MSSLHYYSVQQHYYSVQQHYYYIGGGQTILQTVIRTLMLKEAESIEEMKSSFGICKYNTPKMLARSSDKTRKLNVIGVLTFFVIPYISTRVLTRRRK